MDSVGITKKIYQYPIFTKATPKKFNNPSIKTDLIKNKADSIYTFEFLSPIKILTKSRIVMTFPIFYDLLISNIPLKSSLF